MYPQSNYTSTIKTAPGSKSLVKTNILQHPEIKFPVLQFQFAPVLTRQNQVAIPQEITGI